MSAHTVGDLREAQRASTSPPLPTTEVGTERVAPGRPRVLTASTAEPAPKGISLYTAREGNELFDFIIDHLDEEEHGWFGEDVARAVVNAWQTHSFEPLGRVLADWEETVEIKLRPELSQVLDAAFDEADAARNDQAR